ncbi:hypothetical protein [Nonomuraea rubra]|uniref:Uncharacterized protein n=1 Tax=Nonomuraea rubra TaxID=46180 RepID=A0A7X0U5K1_9ACTN|nr:hypothetical protein [Nonomuraea rubra]MBB6556112.1 hypothetical protein [Nonomuraea rubra]
MSKSVPPLDHPVRWVNGVAHVAIHCGGCGETVRVVGVTTTAGALAEMKRLRIHQHD